MTLENMVEMVKMAHADANVTLIKALLNAANKDFAKECRLIRKAQALVEVGVTPTYTVQTAAQIAAMTGKAAMFANGSYFASLATDLDTVYGIEFLDAAKKPLTTREVICPWFMSAGNLWFGGDSDATLPSPISGVLMRYYAVPATLSLDTDEPSYPADFHEAVPWAVLRKLYGAMNDQSRMGFYRGEYDRVRRSAKMWSNQHQAVSPGNVELHDM